MTYQMAANPPPPMPWPAYEQRLVAEWETLLNSPDGCDERKIHDFLAQHPSMLPGNDTSGHTARFDALLSEVPIGATGVRRPDFIWLAYDSANFKPILVEIESPCKKWFTKGEVPTADLSQAVNQLAQWRSLLNRPENVLHFYDVFDIPDIERKHLQFRPEFILIYGRRKEFDERPQLKRQRAQFEPEGQRVMTFDRLRPDPNKSDYISATRQGNRLVAHSFPATVTVGPLNARSWTAIDNKVEVVDRNDWITPERKLFLANRLPYWDDWGRKSSSGAFGLSDYE